MEHKWKCFATCLWFSFPYIERGDIYCHAPNGQNVGFIDFQKPYNNFVCETQGAVYVKGEKYTSHSTIKILFDLRTLKTEDQFHLLSSQSSLYVHGQPVIPVSLLNNTFPLP